MRFHFKIAVFLFFLSIGFSSFALGENISTSGNVVNSDAATIKGAPAQKNSPVFDAGLKMPKPYNVTANWLNLGESEPKKGTGLLVRTSFSLLIVIAMILAFLWVAKILWFSSKSGARSSIEVLERHQLTANSSLCIVKIKDRVLLLGVGENVNLVCELSRPPKSAFKSLLEGYSESRPSQDVEKIRGDEKYDEFVNEIKHHLDDLKSAIRKRLRG